MQTEFICKICGQKFDNAKSFSNHLTRNHKILSKDYYDKYVKSDNEGICKICGNPTNFKNLTVGYRTYCCNECSRKDKDIYKKLKNTNIERYGVSCSLANIDIRQKAKETKRERYGDENYCNSARIKLRYEEKTLQKFKENVKDCDILSYANKQFTCKCNTCNRIFIVNESFAYLRHYRYHMPICTYCNPEYTFNSQSEKQIVDFIRNGTDDTKPIIDPMNRLQCQICGQEFMKYDCVSRHVKIKHGIDYKEYYDKYFKSEDEGKCLECGKTTSFLGIKAGYNTYCSRACSWKYLTRLNETKDKRINTCIKKYGTPQYINSEEFSKKSENTNLLKFGVKNGGGSKFAINKIRDTKLRLYGDINYNNGEKKELDTIKKLSETISEIEILNYKNKEFTCKCKLCNHEFNIEYQILYNRYFVYHTPICTICNPIDKLSSVTEKNIAEFLNKNNIVVIENDRTVLHGHELDIYLPEKKLAFEYDGLYWHSELYKDKNYHLSKTEECEKQGIQLIHIFEDEWIYKRDIVKSRINGLLGLNNRIFARKCQVKEVPYKESEGFLNMCHIQGNCMSTYRYGLYYNDELVSLMTFGKSRFNKNEFELLRYCNKLNTNVVGGASRLFNHFLKEHGEIQEVISFADRRWSIGNLYKKLEFTLVGHTDPAYYYIIDGIRHNRVEFQKHKLIVEGFSPDKTEHEIMLSRKIYRIYDCGNLKYRFTRLPY